MFYCLLYVSMLDALCIFQGFFGTIKPDQMSAINPLLILLLIPIFEKFIYPCLEKCKCLHRYMFIYIDLIFVIFLASVLLSV